MEWIFYWAEVLNGAKLFFCIGSAIAIVFMSIYNIVEADSCYGSEPNYCPKWFFALFIFMFLIGIFIPSKKTVYTMTGVHIIETVADNEEVKSATENTLDIINLYLEKTKKELENNNE